jgi:hypothetical protein
MTLTDIIAKITLFAKRVIVNDNSSSTAASISQSGSGDAMRITQTGSGNALVVEDSTNPDTTPFIVKSDGKVGIGTTVPSVSVEISNSGDTELRITSSGNQNPTLSLNRASALSWQAVNDLGQLKIQSAGPGIDSAKTDKIFMAPGTGVSVFENVGLGAYNPASRLQVQGDITLTSSTTATTATAGAQTLPANPVGFLVVSINGTSRKIPYYAT